MATSTATLVNRLFTILVLVLTLYTVYQGYLAFVAYGKMRQENTYYKTDNFYRTVADSIRRTLPPPRAKPTIVYQLVPLSAHATQVLVATVTSQVRQEVQRELRATTERLLATQRPPLRATPGRAIVALRDTTICRRSPATGCLVTTAAKTGTFRDPWLSLTGVVIPGQTGRQDSLQVKYLLKLDFSAQAYSTRTATHWWQWWKGRRVYVDLRSNNPNTSPLKLEKLEVQKR